MPRPRTVPCEQCKKKHLKCEGGNPCASCQKTGIECQPGNRQLRLKVYVAPHETPLSGKRKQPHSRPPPATDSQEDTLSGQPTTQPTLDASGTNFLSCFSPPAESPPPQPHHPQLNFASPNPASPYTPSHSSPRRIQSDDSAICTSLDDNSPLHGSATRDRLCDDVASEGHRERPPDNTEGGRSAFLDLALGTYGSSSEAPPYPGTPDGWHSTPSQQSHPTIISHERLEPGQSDEPSQLSVQEACLVRCFSNILSGSFDTTDRARHFGTYIPMRASKNPLLLNALCGVSAQHLLRLHKRPPSSNVIEFEGTSLPDLSEESVLHYQSICIKHLMEASVHPDKYPDHEILPAIIILRYHEQVDVSLTGSDYEVFSRAVQHIFETQFTQGHSLEETLPNLFNPFAIYRLDQLSCNISAYLVALRMEIWAVLIYQRPLRLPIPSFRNCLLRPCDSDHNDDMDDQAWTRRVLIWCAHILQLYYGSEVDKSDSGDVGFSTRTELWGALKGFEYDWDTRRPPCVSPLRYRDRDPSQGRYFPEIWQTNPCQVMALQHIEFGRIVLAQHESHLQARRLGLGASNEYSETLFRTSTRIICGLTVCHPGRHEALTAAGTAISMCGRYFYDPGERAAMMGILATLQNDLAWNVSQAIEALRMAEVAASAI